MREDGWITKTEAAALLGVDERTIERRARAGRIQARMKPGFPTLYRQADVEILRQTGAGEVQTGVYAPGPAGNGNGHGVVASLRGPALWSEAWFVEVVQHLRAALTRDPIGPTGPTSAPTGPTATRYVTVKEAAAILGLPQVDVLDLIHDGDLPHRQTRRGGIRIRRKDLEAL